MKRLPATYSRWFRALTLLIALSSLFSAALLTWGSKRGFDLTDEGLYMLYYTFPKDYSATFSGFHLLLQPVSSVIRLDVVELRLIRIVLLLLANISFAACFLHWLDRSFPASHMTRAFKPLAFWLLTLGLVMPYTWLAQTPGYNDFAAVFGLAVAGCVLLALAPREAGRPSRGWFQAPVVLAGFFLALLSFIKWTSAIGLSCMAGAAIVVALPDRTMAARTRAAVFLLAGIGTGLLCIHLLCYDLTAYFGNLAKLTNLATQRTSGGDLLSRYWHETFGAFSTIVRRFWWLFPLLLFAPTIFYGSVGRRYRIVLWLLVVASIVGVLRVERTVHFLRGGAQYMPTSTSAYLALIAVAGACCASFRWRSFQLWRMRSQQPRPACRLLHQDTPPTAFRSPSITIGSRATQVTGLAFLFLLPFTVSAGTAGHIFAPALYLLSAWNAVLMVFCVLLGNYRLGRHCGWIICLMAAVLMMAQFLYGYCHRPYRLAGSLFEQTQAVTGLARGTELLFDQPTADFLTKFSSLYRSTSPAHKQPIIALYDMPGLVYLLGGISPGTVWYSDEPGWRNPGSVPVPDKSTAVGEDPNTRPFLMLPPQLRQDVLEILRARLDYPQAYRMAGAVRRPRTDAFAPTDSDMVCLWVPIPK